jgi:hypothetical protein
MEMLFLVPIIVVSTSALTYIAIRVFKTASREDCEIACTCEECRGHDCADIDIWRDY